MGCIYMYTNKINGMKYIGQTVRNISVRHTQHLCQDQSYIDRALRKYGENNFELTILEDDIYDNDKLNEREMYWIEKYDTFNNGYNLTKGGLGGAKFDKNDALKIIELIKNSKKTFQEIGEETGYSLSTISDINNGDTCHFENVEYPIRRNKITQKYFQETLDLVLDFIVNTEYSFHKIAEITNTDWYYVCDVNRGKVGGDYHNIAIPVRKYKYERSNMNKELAQTVVKYLKQNDLSAEQIAKILNIPAYTVGQLNRGKMAICKELNETYPIRTKQYRNGEIAQTLVAKLSKNEVLEIVDLLLNTTLSLEEISRRYNVSKVSIDRINQKKVWKNVLAKYEAPIRTNPRNKNICLEGIV